MDELYVGAVLERPPGKSYPETLSYAEIAPKVPLPRAGTLRGWRERVPSRIRLGLVTPRIGGRAAKANPPSDEDIQSWAVEAAAALDAIAIVTPTGPEITPGQRGRERLKRFFGDLPEGPVKVWAPGGVWEAEEAERVAKAIGVVAAVDPLIDKPSGNVVYARLLGLGARSRLSEGMLGEVATRLQQGGHRTVFAAVISDRSVRDASALQSLVSLA